MPNVCLTMIVRNEGATIARCIRAAKKVITHWSIVDTGSTDNTREIILDELSGIPGELHERPWKNFGHNRSESYHLARQWMRSRWLLTPERSWCLLLDADHELEFKGFHCSDLVAPAYMLFQHDSALTYANIRMIRADVAARCIGVTHEFWDVQTRETLPSLTILDHADGGTRHEKYERDERLLIQGLRDEPGNERYMFYLAQTYEGMGKRDQALEWYRRRASAGGFEEERWMAQYRLGQLLIAA